MTRWRVGAFMVMGVAALGILFGILTLMPGRAIAQEKKRALSWYDVIVEEGQSSRHFVGSTTLGEDEFIRSCTGTALVRLDDLIYKDNVGKYKLWTEWDPLFQDRVYMNPKYIIAVNPLMHDPRETSSK